MLRYSFLVAGVAATIATKAREKQNPDQPFTRVACATIVSAKEVSAAAIATTIAATKARKKQDNPDKTATAVTSAKQRRVIIATAVASC